MKYSKEEVLQFVEEEDVKFIRLAFIDVNGKPKNISVMSNELKTAFTDGIPVHSQALLEKPNFRYIMLLHPDPSTLTLLPWRPDHGRVARMYCNLTDEEGTPIPEDARQRLMALSENDDRTFRIACDFYLFPLDENGSPAKVPYDYAGYLDMAPLDKCENIRREICLSLESMGIIPRTSSHSFGPGQNCISFDSKGALAAADNLASYVTTVRTLAKTAGLYADFSMSPIRGENPNMCTIEADNSSKVVTILPEENPYVSIIKNYYE